MPIPLRNQEASRPWGEALSAEAREAVVRDLFDLELIPWQRDLFEAVGGPSRPKVHYLQIARKAGKTFALAAFIMSELVLEPDSEIYVFSDSQTNLRAVLFSELQSWVQICRDPSLFKIHYDKIVYVPTGGFVRIRASNHQASQGLNPTTVVFDELHLQRSDRVYNGAIMAGAARTSPLVLAATTPGYDSVSLAHDMDQMVRKGEISGRIYEPTASVEAAYTDRDQWRISNPGLGYTFDMDSLENDFRLMPQHEFSRFRLGCWTETASAWLPYGAWKAREAPSSLNLGDDVWVGFDGSVSGDSTALVACSSAGHLTVMAVWEKPTLGGAPNWRVPRQEVMDAVDRLFADYNVVSLYADPPWYAREIAEWDQKYPGRIVEFPTNSPARMGPACSAFYSAVMDGLLSHDGDTRLANHVANAASRPTASGDCITKESKDSPRKIDLAVASVLAYHGMATAARQKKAVHVW